MTIVAIVYLTIGVMFSMAADFGYKRRYAQPMSNKLWLAGVALWPFMLSLGRRR